MQAYQQIQTLYTWLNNQIIGQEHLNQRLLIALLADGHLLVEGAPGLAKTKAIKTLAQAIEGDFHRIQFTPDLLPSDVTGTDIYRPDTAPLNSRPARFFTTSSSLMKSTAPRPRYSLRCWKRWPSAR